MTACVMLLGLLPISIPSAGAEEMSEPLWSYETGDWVESVAISADGRYIAAGVADPFGYSGGKVFLFEQDKKEPSWRYQTDGAVRSVAISAGGEYIAAGTGSGSGEQVHTVYLFERNSSTPLWKYTAEEEVSTVKISGNGNYVVAGSNDNNVYFFHKNRSTPLWNFSTNSSVSSVAISADGEYLTATSNKTVYFFARANNTPLWNYTSGGVFYSVSISATGEYLAAGAMGGTIYLFQKDNGTPMWSYRPGGFLSSAVVAISADGHYLATGQSDPAGGNSNNIYLFSHNSSSPLWNYTPVNPVFAVAISADGRYLAAGSSDNFGANEHELFLFDRENGTLLWSSPTAGLVRSLALSSDGEYLAVGSYDLKVRLFHKSGKAEGGVGNTIKSEENSSVSLIAAATSLLALVGLAYGYHASGETGRYRLWAALAPLLARRRERRMDKTLAHETRGAIRGFLVANPGSHYRQLKRELKLTNGTLAHHLRILEREGLVTSQARGQLRCFYPVGEGLAGSIVPAEEGQVEPPPLGEARQRILAIVAQRPGLSQKELAAVLGVTGPAVKYHVDALIQAGRLRRERRGMRVAYYIVKS